MWRGSKCFLSKCGWDMVDHESLERRVDLHDMKCKLYRCNALVTEACRGHSHPRVSSEALANGKGMAESIVHDKSYVTTAWPRSSRSPRGVKKSSFCLLDVRL